MIERRVLRFHGRVQGVGFRYAVERLAIAFPGIAGEVFNEADHVTLDVEGEAGELAAFINLVYMRPPRSARIESTDSATGPVTGRRGFHVGPTQECP